MKSCSVSFKIKDYFPKIDTIPFDEYVCLFINGDFNEKIPLIEKDYNICKHQINNVNSDLKYKIHLVNINDFSLIGMCEIIIPYSIISQIETPGSFIKEQQLKLLIDLKTKRKLFGTIVSSGDIYLYISAEVFVNNNITIVEKKKKNSLKNKNGQKKEFNINYIFGNNKKYRIIKTDKDALRNECKTFTCLKNITNSNINNSIMNEFLPVPLSQDRKEQPLCKFQSNHFGAGFKSTLTIDGNLKNLKNQNQKVKKVHTQRKKISILDLMEQKVINKRKIKNKSTYTNINHIIKKNNNSPNNFKSMNSEDKENVPLNYQNKNKNNYCLFSDKTSKSNTLNAVLSPVSNNSNILMKDKINYIYKKKSAQKIKARISENNIFNVNSSSPYCTNFNIYEESADRSKNNIAVKKNKSCSTAKFSIQNENTKTNNLDNNINNFDNNTNNANDDDTILTFSEGKPKLSDLDKIIIEKSNIIKSDFQNQLNCAYKQNKLLLDSTYEQSNNNKNMINYSSNNVLNDMMNIKYNRSQKDFHKKNKNLKYNNNSCMKIDLDSSKNITYNMTPCSSNQHMNFFSQEELRNNILNLLDFYSLLKKKFDMVKENNEQNNQKLVIKKEKFNHQLKKNNRLTQKIISVESKIILHATINCTLNEQIILPLIKIKKMESNIYQNIFGLSCYDYDIIKHKEKEKNKLFEEQNIIHLLLIIIKNMIEHYGNISSHVFQDDINKNKMLKLLLLKYEIEEKKEGSINMNLNINKINSKYSNFNNSQFLPGQIVDDDFLNKFKIIREVEEDKEYDDSEEENIKQKNTDNKNEEIIESIIVDVDDNNINDTKNEKEFENGATKNEPEKVITHEDNQYINNSCENKIDLINKILFEEFPKKYPNENKFIYKSNTEYIFGENVVNINVNDNNLELLINGEKYSLDEFIKLFSNHKTSINSNGIDTGVDSDKKSDKDKNNKTLSHKDNEEDIVGDEINTSSSQKKDKSKISENKEKIKNGADSTEKRKKDIINNDDKKDIFESPNLEKKINKD